MVAIDPWQLFLPCVSDTKGIHRVEKTTFMEFGRISTQMLSSACCDTSLLGKTTDRSSLRTVEQRSSTPFSHMLGPVFGSPLLITRRASLLAFIGNKDGLYAPALDWTGLIIPGIIDLHYFGSRVSLRLAEGPLFHVVARLLCFHALLAWPGTPTCR